MSADACCCSISRDNGNWLPEEGSQFLYREKNSVPSNTGIKIYFRLLRKVCTGSMIDSEKTDMDPFSGKMPGKESIHIFLKKEKKA